MPPFKDEHILLVAPGSQTTLAQLGLPESFTPARFRFPTRMFASAKKGEWEPYKVRQRVIKVKKPARTPSPAPEAAAEPTETGEPAATNGEEQKNTTQGAEAKDQMPEQSEEPKTQEQADTVMKDAADGEGQDAEQKEAEKEDLPMIEEEQLIFEEDFTSDEGATYPICNGKIVDWPCFFALLTHIYNTISPPFHTPVMLIAQPAWTARDREMITQFIFEKFKTPAFCMMDSALAVCYAYGTANATVVDVGYQKADITAVSDFIVNEHGRGIAMEGCGGEAMTDRLHELLAPKGFSRDMCEQLKKSNITEILPAGTPLPFGSAKPGDAAAKEQSSLKPPTTQPPGKGPEMSRNNGETEDDEGVLDVATIVSSGNTSEYLARRERERAERSAARGDAGGDTTTAKPVRLPNAKKEKATFQYEELANPETQEAEQNGNETAGQPVRHKREIEVGLERFLPVTPNESSDGGYGILDKLAAQIHHSILSVPDAPKRSELWDSLIILGNGSKIKGFPQALLSTITQKYVLSPSSGTIFTSEIPSSLSTPLATGGTTTPANPQNPGPQSHPAAHGVNPLLVAATHANNPALQNSINANAGISSSDPNAIALHHRSTGHSQTPTSIKQLKPPEYFPEWKAPGSTTGNSLGGPNNNNAAGNNASQGGPTTPNTGSAAGGPSVGNTTRGGGGANIGMEEAVFLGAQVAAKVIFVVDQGLSKGFMSRVEYNEMGPTAIHEYSL